jgi:VIT1/CCC1 family predicted Fe2+/Mn2+ transporter
MLSEFIYGGMDGVITTVAIIGGSLGARISDKYVLALGASNIIADGFSMGLSRYNSLVNISSSQNNNANSALSKKSPIQSAFVTFISFVILGVIPLAPFIVDVSEQYKIVALFLSAMFAFTIIGYVKGRENNNTFYSIMETLVIGTLGASISYYVASYVKDLS